MLLYTELTGRCTWHFAWTLQTLVLKYLSMRLLLALSPTLTSFLLRLFINYRLDLLVEICKTKNTITSSNRVELFSSWVTFFDHFYGVILNLCSNYLVHWVINRWIHLVSLEAIVCLAIDWRRFRSCSKSATYLFILIRWISPLFVRGLIIVNTRLQ